MKRIITKASALVQKVRGMSRFGRLGYSFREMPSLRGKIYLHKSGTLSVGKRLNILGRPWATQLTVAEGASLLLGDKVFINSGCGIAASKEIKIGNHVSIGPRTSILDSNYHRLDAGVSYEDLKSPIVIEDNVWIGTRCTILPGVRIGKNSVIAAGSIVNKDIPPNVVAGGNPAKVIRELTVPEGWIRG